MAHTKAQRAVKGNRDSISKRRGVKLFGGQIAHPGNIIVRQKGTKVHEGPGVMRGKDFTLMATEEGTVTYYKRSGKLHVKIEKSSKTNSA